MDLKKREAVGRMPKALTIGAKVIESK